MIDGNRLKNDFPLFKRRICGKPIVYLDSAATALKPQKVIDAVNSYYKERSANVFRGIYTISEEATAAYENSRTGISDFINAYDTSEIIFTKNTTESLNLIAYSWFCKHIEKGDTVVSTIMEHHSNFVPWQQMCKEKKADFVVWKCSKDGIFQLSSLDKLITRKTKLFTFTAASNVLGTIHPVEDIVKRVKAMNPDCLVVVDAAQAVPHMPVDVRQWGADAIAFSGHKMMGPSGVGVLWMKKELLMKMKPFLYGGDMIKEVYEQRTVFNDIPHKFEAGTPYIEGAIGLGAAVSYLTSLGMKNIRSHEKQIVSYAMEQLATLKDVTVYGPTNSDIHGGVLAFQIAGVHPHDVAEVLNQDNICIRVGFHCAMPIHSYLEIGPTCRASFYVYTSKKDVDVLIDGLMKVKKMFK